MTDLASENATLRADCEMWQRQAGEYADNIKELVTEVYDLRHDIDRHQSIASDLATENERLRAENESLGEIVDDHLEQRGINRAELGRQQLLIGELQRENAALKAHAEAQTTLAVQTLAQNEKLADEVAALQAERDACNQYLKDGETPAARIERERNDTLTMAKMYEKTVRERDALRADAERYRFMRGQNRRATGKDEEEFDAAIDAARKE